MLIYLCQKAKSQDKKGKVMKYYSILPIDWDYSKREDVYRFQKQGIWVPTMIQEVVDHCGSLYPYVIYKTNAIKRLRALKKKFPFVYFVLYEGKTVGELQIVAER